MKMLVRNNKVFRNEIKTQVRLLRDARKETKFGGTAWKTYTRELVKARRQMSSLPLRKLGTDLRNVTNMMLTNAKNLQWVGRQMIVGITAPLGIMLRSSMQAFEAFEKQFVRTKKILGLTGDAEETLRKRMHDLSTQLGVSRSIVAGLTSDFAQMGKFWSSAVPKCVYGPWTISARASRRVSLQSTGWGLVGLSCRASGYGRFARFHAFESASTTGVFKREVLS